MSLGWPASLARPATSGRTRTRVGPLIATVASVASAATATVDVPLGPVSSSCQPVTSASAGARQRTRAWVASIIVAARRSIRGPRRPWGAIQRSASVYASSSRVEPSWLAAVKAITGATAPSVCVVAASATASPSAVSVAASCWLLASVPPPLV